MNIIEQFIVAIVGWIPTFIGNKIRYYIYKRMFKKTNGVFSIGTGVTILGFKNIEIGNIQIFE